jgi:tRNA wybutosine-synthesizing protein 1
MVSLLKKKDLEKQGYRIVGNHSAVKICSWTKKSLRKEGVCYKEAFYDSKSHRCVQMTPALHTCTHRCVWCWRDINFTKEKFSGKVDSPKEIIDGCIKEFVKALEGYHGYKSVDKKKLKEINKPQQFAISLTGEPTAYPKLPELIKELNERSINSFLVTNGTNPTMLKKMLDKKIQPTQVYITLPCPDKESYVNICNPLIKNGWSKILKSLELVCKFKRNVFRLTLVKDVNMINPEKYASLIEKYKPKYVELKAYMWVGHSRERLEISKMPYMEDMIAFAKEIVKNCSYKIKDKKKESRVVLLSKK